MLPEMEIHKRRLLLWSVLAVFSQLTFVRIYSTAAGATAYYSNLFLLLAIFALGSGFLAVRLSQYYFLTPTFFLLAFNLALALGCFNLVDVMPHEFQWHSIANITPQEADFDLQLAVILLGVALLPVHLLIGSRQAAVFSEGKFTRDGYILMAAGGIAGAVLFALQNLLWPHLGVLLFLWSALFGSVLHLDPPPPMQRLIAFATLLLILPVGLLAFPDSTWSSYQRISAERRGDRLFFFVNGFFIQTAWTIGAREIPSDRRRVLASAPMTLVRPSDRVLVLGAGTGTNDVREAVFAGARHVTGVEIDPAFVDWGRAIDPDRTYEQPNVRVVVDDARHFLSKNREPYDILFFNYLDSQTHASNHARFRLDSFLYTVEGLRQAFASVNPDGVLFLSFATATPWIRERIYATLSAATRAEVRVFRVENAIPTLYAVSKGREITLKPPSYLEVTQTFRQGRPVDPATDDWPFLYSLERSLPKEYVRLLAIMGLVFIVTFLVSDRFSRPSLLTPTKRGWNQRALLAYAFFSGAAFFFVELRTISVMVPLVGSTYIGQAAVIIGILVVSLSGALLANHGRLPAKGWVWGILWCSLLLSLAADPWFHPFSGEYLRSLPLLLGSLLAPLFVAGSLYLLYLRGTDSEGILAMQKWNLIGGAVGGLAECVVIVWGFKSSLYVALVLYGLAMASVALHSPAAAASLQPEKDSP